MTRLAGLLPVVLLLVWEPSDSGLARAAPGAVTGDCLRDTAGVDTSGWNSGRGTFLGKALGQTFQAVDTVITRITAWRAPNNIITTALGVHLFVTMVDITRIPPRPVTQEIILDGPIVRVRDSDPPGQPIRMDFVLDPPLVLPHPGIYAFFLQLENCNGGEASIIAKEPGDAYLYGTYWITGRVTDLPCFLRAVDTWENLDLCFEVEFCREAVTAPRTTSWGRLKVIYR